MGSAKLLLPWGDGLLIDRVLGVWAKSEVDEIVVVVRKEDRELSDACHRHPVRLVHPNVDPQDMKDSVQWGLREIETVFNPSDRDRCFIAPADLPNLSREIIDRLIRTESDASSIVVPRFGDRQGHPVLLPWPLTAAVFQLGAGEGVDQVVKRHPKRSVSFPAGQRVMDVDTPEQYEYLRRNTGEAE